MLSLMFKALLVLNAKFNKDCTNNNVKDYNEN